MTQAAAGPVAGDPDALLSADLTLSDYELGPMLGQAGISVASDQSAVDYLNLLADIIDANGGCAVAANLPISGV